MPNLTLSLPEDVYRVIKTHKEIRWSEIARRSITDYAARLALLDQIAEQSKLTEEDVKVIDDKIKAGILKHYLERQT